MAEKAEAITEYFLVNTGYLQKELFVEYHFSTALRGMLSLVFSPTTSVDVTSTSGTNKADDVVFDSALDFIVFSLLTQKVSQKRAKEQLNLLNNQNLFQKGVKVVSFVHQ